MGSRLEKKSNLVRKRIEQHTFDDEQGEEYEGSKFGDFPEYFRRKKIKLQNLDAEVRANSSKPQILRGIVCHVNGYTQPSLNDLHVMIVEHGGGFVQYLDGKTMVTHIIASNLTPKKKDEFRRYRIVKPAWIVDSINAGKILPWDAYRVIDEGVGQKVLTFEDGQVVSQAGKKSAGYREQTDSSWYTHKLKDVSSIATVPEQHVAFDESFGDGSLNDEDLAPLLADGHPNEQSSTDEDELGEREDRRKTTTSTGKTTTTTAPDSPERSAGSPRSPSSLQADNQAEAEQSTTLQPRQGSQEPDYTMAVIANSNILKAVPPERLAGMTAEEHNALLLSDPKIRKSTVVNPDFLEQYYRESRLHHLSTWKAELKSQLQAMTADKSAKKPAAVKRPTGQRRYIMHVDFDCFFAAVSLINEPQFKDKPAVVAHGGGSGSEIASCNYPARAFGVKNGMWMRRAQELCPDLKILPYDFAAYERASRHFYDAILATGGVVQSVSIDEALVDISDICHKDAGTDGVKRNEGGVYREQHTAETIAENLRDAVFKSTGCAVSIGIGGNILLAKVALRKAKPAGQFHLKPEEMLDFIGKLEVQALPGVAWSIGGKLEDIGIKLVQDVRDCSRERLLATLGPKTGEKIWDYARGIDRAEVGDQVVRKSVSAEVNWGVRFETQEQVDEFMVGLCGELHKRLMREGVKGKQLTMKVMRRAADAPLDPPKHLGHGKCDTFNKSLQLGVATNDAALLTKEAVIMMKSFGISPGELRGIGVQMQKLEPLRMSDSGKLASSQKRLQFKQSPQAKSVAAVRSELSDNDTTVSDHQSSVLANSNALHDSSADTKMLNTAGTQFLLPTQVDTRTLAELPPDIRSKLVKQSLPSPSAASAMPTASQLDPETLNELPQEIRDELAALYGSPRRQRQMLLPNSPQKPQGLSKVKPIPKRKKGVGPSKLYSRFRNARDPSTLTQSNFVARPGPADGSGPSNDHGEQQVEDIDEAFLSALPDDIRKEVLDQQRQLRLQKTGGIDISMHQKPRALQKQNTRSMTAERVLALDPLPSAPTFTSRKLFKLADLRDAMSAWVTEFADEGPFDDDVSALVEYLKQVVETERDLDKAVSVSRWLAWTVHTWDEHHLSRPHSAWQDAVKATEHSIQQAAGHRGLGRVQFDL